MHKVLVTGATGFIGRRLVLLLLEQGHFVYALSRIRGIDLRGLYHPNLKVLWGDFQNTETMDPWPEEIEAAYYLIHSMAEDVSNLLSEEEKHAAHFVEKINQTKCKQVLYLGGIIQEGRSLSPHLLSRKNVEEVLKKGKPSLTVLRASIIIGAGSASFEIIRDLVEKLPLMVAPKWVNTKCQPIAVSDVLYYLSMSLLEPSLYNQTYEIGGPEVMTFKEVLLRYAAFRGLKRWIISVPVLTPRLSSYWLVFITSVRFSLCFYLVESMKCDSYCTDERIFKALPHSCLSFEESLKRAFETIETREIPSTWMDAWVVDKGRADIRDLLEPPKEGCFKDIQIVLIKGSAQDVIGRVWSLGGDKGWYGLNWAWKLRGLIDKLFKGSGMNRGRRHPTEIAVGDPIDFWRAIKVDKESGYLLLFAEMKLPGKAWVEFRLEGKEFYQTAFFLPKGILGRLYWYCMLPFHFFIFKKMARKLAQT